MPAEVEEVAEPRRAYAGLPVANEEFDEAPVQVIEQPKQPEREDNWGLEEDVKASSNYSEDDGWGATGPFRCRCCSKSKGSCTRRCHDLGCRERRECGSSRGKTLRRISQNRLLRY